MNDRTFPFSSTMPLLILVADDDPDICASLRDYLELSGYSVITAPDGKQAVKLLEDCQPHLLISDIQMPFLDGYELVRKIRQKPNFRLLPVIFLTQKNQTQDRIEGYKIGCDLYLPKPFELHELGAIVRNLLEKSLEIAQSFSAENGEIKPTLNLNITNREQEVLSLLTQGLSNGEIGEILFLSPRTIEKHVSSLLRKTETGNRSELLRFALTNNLVR
jgi:DNA-binding NarL/FixJ family response regulator